MIIDNRKVIGFNVEVLKFIRLYGVEDTTFGWLLAFLAISNNFLQFTDMMLNYKDKSIDSLVIHGFLFACLFNINHRFKVYLLKKTEMNSVMEYINDVWDKTESSNNPIEKEILENSLSRGSKIILFNLGSLLFGITLAACYPLIIGARELPYEWGIPGTDLHKSPLYDLLYLYQALYVIPGITCVSITYSNLVLTWLIFGLISFQLLGEKIRQVSTKLTDEDSMEALHECIRLHTRIIDFINVVEGIISPVSFLEVVLLSLMLCFLMFYALYVSATYSVYCTILYVISYHPLFLQLNENFIMLITVISYVVCVLYMVFMVFLHANDLTYESVAIADRIYDLNWYEQSTQFKTCVLLFMTRSQRPIQLRAGIYPLTLPTFVQLIKASYTYVTVLKQVYY